MGLQFSSVAYNVFALSVLSFVAQLETPPGHTLDVEKTILTKAAPGPHRWCSADDLWHLQDSFGLAFRFRNLSLMATSAQIRVTMWEASASGGLNVDKHAARLDQALIDTDLLGRRVRLASWFNGAHIFVLRRSLAFLRALQWNEQRLLRELTNDAPRPWTPQIVQRAKNDTQRLVYKLLSAPKAGWPQERLRHKIQRWQLPGTARAVTDRVLKRLRALQALVPPRVHAALFSTLWNRWVTARRFQRRSSAECRCLLGCPPAAEDSIEHYLRCPVVLDFGRRRLAMYMNSQESFALLLLATGPPGTIPLDSWLKRCALLIYAIYRTTNAARHSRPFGVEEARRALAEALYEGARGHRNATAVADGCFS